MVCAPCAAVSLAWLLCCMMLKHVITWLCVGQLCMINLNKTSPCGQTVNVLQQMIHNKQIIV